MTDSRFFKMSDDKDEKFFFNLPKSWWSRPYEYHWAIQFTEKSDIVLDAAAGICHPFKFALVDSVKEVYACDLNKKILSTEHILDEIKHIFDNKSVDKVVEGDYLNRINMLQTNISELSYTNHKFDKVFCLSVMEHLDFETLKKTFKEFKRTLKNDGIIVLTFDYPSMNFDYLKEIMKELDLRFVGPISYELPKDALYSDMYRRRLYCFRALIKKNNHFI